MANGFSGYSTSTVGFRLGSAVLLVGVIVHTVGFSVARWATINISGDVIYSIEVNFYFGLWQSCACVTNTGMREKCTCVSRSDDPAWFKTVQAMETLGLVGLICSGIISVVLVCYRQRKTIAITNILLLVCSGACILIGLVIFGVKNDEDDKNVKDMFGMTATSTATDGKLSTSFILCALAALICFGVLPLFVTGVRTLNKIPQPVTLPTMQGSNECHVTISHPGQTQKICNTEGQSPVHQQSSYMLVQIGQSPARTYEQHEAPPSYTFEQHEATPAYTFEQHGAPPAYTFEQHEATPTYTFEQHEATPAYTFEQHEATPAYTSEQHEATPAYTFEQHEATPAYTFEQHEATPAYTFEQHEATLAYTFEQHGAPPTYA